MKIISPIIRSAKRSLKGEEKLWIVFWLWGIVLYLSSLLIGFFVFSTRDLAASWVGGFVGWLGFILALVYPIMFCISLWKCSQNTKREWCRYGAKFYAVIFIPAIHWWVSWFINMASIALISNNSGSGV